MNVHSVMMEISSICGVCDIGGVRIPSHLGICIIIGNECHHLVIPIASTSRELPAYSRSLGPGCLLRCLKRWSHVLLFRHHFSMVVADGGKYMV